MACHIGAPGFITGLNGQPGEQGNPGEQGLPGPAGPAGVQVGFQGATGK